MNDHDLSTQLDHECLLIDGNGNSVTVSFDYFNYKHVVPSEMECEVNAFSDFLDIAARLSAELGDIFQRQISVQLLRGSKHLFYFISKVSRTSEKRIMREQNHQSRHSTRHQYMTLSPHLYKTTHPCVNVCRTWDIADVEFNEENNESNNNIQS